MPAEILRKLTIRNCGFAVADIREVLKGKDDGVNVEILKIVGKTTAARRGQSDLGAYIKLNGEFTAVNGVTGEVFSSSACILPNFISEGIEAALVSSQFVEFGLSVGVKSVPESATGYEYTMKPLIEAKPSESMASLLSAAGIDPSQPALPAPPKPARAPGRPKTK